MFEIAAPILVCYGVYYIIWTLFIKPSGARQAARHATTSVPAGAAASAAQTPAPAVPSQTPADRYAERVRRRRARPSWRDRAHHQLVATPLREKITSLLGSMLSAAMFAALAALVALVLSGASTASSTLAVYFWLALVGTLGSWAVLVPTKFAEGKLEDHTLLRISMLLIGGLVGTAAWWLAGLLLVHVPSVGEPIGANWGLLSHELLKWNVTRGAPSLPMYVTYFALLFLLVRWWRQAEFTRSQRLSLWSVVACVFGAWLLQFLTAFPQPAGMLIAGIMSFATQLASPWLPPSRRRVLAENVEQVA